MPPVKLTPATVGNSTIYATYNYWKTINVGPTRQFTRITDAVNSLRNIDVLGKVNIQVDNGTYIEPTIYLKEKNLSNKLIITGNIATPSACIVTFQPDPFFADKVGNDNFNLLESEIFTESFSNLLVTTNTINYNSVGFGFVANLGFKLTIAGMSLVGGSTDGVNSTYCMLLAMNGSGIKCLAGSMILTGGIEALHAQHGSTITAKNILMQGFKGITVFATFNSTITITGSTITGAGNNTAPMTVTTYPYFNIIAVQSSNNSVVSYPIIIDTNSNIEGLSLYIVNFPSAIIFANNSSGVLDNSFLSFIGTSSSVELLTNSSLSLGNCIIDNSGLPSISGNCCLISTSLAVSGTIPSGFTYVRSSVIVASNTVTSLSGLTNPYGANAVSGSETIDGSVIQWS